MLHVALLAAGAALIYPERASDLLGVAIIAAVYIADAALGGRLGSKDAQRLAEAKQADQAEQENSNAQSQKVT